MSRLWVRAFDIITPGRFTTRLTTLGLISIHFGVSPIRFLRDPVRNSMAGAPHRVIQLGDRGIWRFADGTCKAEKATHEGALYTQKSLGRDSEESRPCKARHLLFLAAIVALAFSILARLSSGVIRLQAR